MLRAMLLCQESVPSICAQALFCVLGSGDHGDLREFKNFHKSPRSELFVQLNAMAGVC